MISRLSYVQQSAVRLITCFYVANSRIIVVCNVTQPAVVFWPSLLDSRPFLFNNKSLEFLRVTAASQRQRQSISLMYVLRGGFKVISITRPFDAPPELRRSDGGLSFTIRVSKLERNNFLLHRQVINSLQLRESRLLEGALKHATT